MYIKRFIRLFCGLFCCALGISLSIQGNVGVTPWDVLHQGISAHTGLSYGVVSIAVGLTILCISAFMGEKVGAGTLCNIVGIGLMVDVIQAAAVIPQAQNLVIGCAMVALSLLVLATGTFLYIGAAMGSGPRDSMMTAFSKRLPKIPVGLIRGAIETVVLIGGFFLGGQVGAGTVIGVFGIGPAIQLVFGLAHFDVKSVRHESLLETAKNIFSRSAAREAA